MLFRHIGVPELLIILVIALLIFGPGRIAKLGTELGKGIRGFKSNVKTEEDKQKTEDEESTDAE